MISYWPGGQTGGWVGLRAGEIQGDHGGAGADICWDVWILKHPVSSPVTASDSTPSQIHKLESQLVPTDILGKTERMPVLFVVIFRAFWCPLLIPMILNYSLVMRNIIFCCVENHYVYGFYRTNAYNFLFWTSKQTLNLLLRIEIQRLVIILI